MDFCKSTLHPLPQHFWKPFLLAHPDFWIKLKQGLCQDLEDVTVDPTLYVLREAFQTKKRGNLGNGPNRGGGRQKIKKVPDFSWEKFKIELNMAKYIIISLILTDFVATFFILNLFQKNLKNGKPGWAWAYGLKNAVYTPLQRPPKLSRTLLIQDRTFFF